MRIAVVEDQDIWADTLREYLQRFGREKQCDISVVRYRDGYELVDPYPGNLDIILMDIEMGLMNGMEAAERVRKQDDAVVIIFVTNVAQYALQGYRVHAMDYILKPISYTPFAESLKRAIRVLEKQQGGWLTVRTRTMTERIYIPEICWIESRGHRLTFHLQNRELETTVFSMKEMEEELKPAGFARCSSGYLVNLHHVTGFRENEVIVEGDVLSISRGRRASFMEALLTCLGE